MRPIASDQDNFRYPLNELLGTRANIRLLRVMANEVEGPLTAPDVAKRAGLTVPGAQKALNRLYRTGFISRIGGGRRHQYEIYGSDPLIQATLKLFKAEKNRYERLLNAIKAEVNGLIPPPQAIWMCSFPMEIGEPLTLGLLHEVLHLASGIRQFREKLNQVEKEFNQTIELVGYTKADLLELDLDAHSLLYGVIPSQPKHYGQQVEEPRSHGGHEKRILGFSRELAKAIQQDTSLLRRAKDHIDHLLLSDHGMANNDLKEWHDILENYSIQRLSKFLLSSSARANRLRQSNPFFAVLTADERIRLIDLEDNDDAGST